MSTRLLALAVGAHSPLRLARFWADLLGRGVVEAADGAAVPGEDGQLGLRFVPDARDPAGPSPMHLHLTSASLADQQHTVARALELGAGHLDVGQLPQERHVVLADPEGYEFCVIEPGNAFLAGCGLLGELACDGTREVGLFWSQALEWPLVWDQGPETAIQSPQGGTKVAWGGPPVAARTERARQRLVLAPADGDLDGEAERLVRLGAGRLGAGRVGAGRVGPGQDGVLRLIDPGGNEFELTSIARSRTSSR